MNICITEEIMVLQISIIANGNNDNFVVLITEGRKKNTNTNGGRCRVHR